MTVSVTLLTPPGGLLSKFAPAVFDIDDDQGLGQYLVYAFCDTLPADVAFVSPRPGLGALLTNYTSSAEELSSTKLRVSVLRKAGWTVSPRLEIIKVDTAQVDIVGIEADIEQLQIDVADAQADADAALAAANTHATRHIRGGLDAIQADLLRSDYVPTNYARTTDATATNVEHWRAHFKGIDAALLAARTETIRGRLSVASATTPLYFYPGGKQDNDTHSTTIEDHTAMWGRAGYLTNFRLFVQTSSGDADTATFSIYINGVATALSISSVSGTDTSTFYGPDTSQVTVALTDRITIVRENGSGTGSWQDVVWSVDFVKAL